MATHTQTGRACEEQCIGNYCASLMKKKKKSEREREEQQCLNVKGEERRGKNTRIGTSSSRTHAQTLQRIIDERLMNDAEVQSSLSQAPHSI